MPRKSRRRPAPRSSILSLVVIVLIAGFAGWWLLSPRRHPTPKHPAQATATPQESPTPESVETSTPLEATQSPEPSPAPTESSTPLPVISPRAAASGGTAKLALIVDDCGQWLDTERGYLALGVPLTMSVLPDVHYTSLIAQEAQDAGKGVMLHLPMETISGMDPGPGKVTTEMTDAQITAMVQADLAQVPLARGVNNHEGSKGSSDTRVMNDVIAVLAKHGNLFFIDSKTSPTSVGEQVAAAQGVPTAARDVFLDNKEDVAYSEGQLREAAAIAKRTGSAIAIGHPRPTTLAAVKALIPELQAEGIEFVLASDLVSR
ncbi:MAG TPA: divergent polysaccharide deacetylase family protein [Candidatus Acidoferrales bacterium]|nr:divergent polysaccharide deacetylase family protein [Candidatus Acidoferrales bacterium]